MADKKHGLTAGIIIIGDEILKGHIQDANSHYLCHQLWLLGIKVGKITVVPDDLDSIAEEVRRFAPSFDFVITTGGVGPTHDDVTLEAVGQAFGEELYPHPDVLKLFFGDEKNDDKSNPWRKMAMVPKSTKMHIRPTPSGDFSFLLFAIHNVHCYPGVPSLLKTIFQECKDLYSQSSTKFYLKEVFFSCGEGRLAHPLSKVQEDFPRVQLGSYPDDSSSHNYSVKVTLESDDQDQVEKAYARLMLMGPSAAVLSAKNGYETTSSSSIRSSLSWLLQKLPGNKASIVPTALCNHIQKSTQIIEKALEQYGFGGVCVAFNGGKDCTVNLALFHAILEKRGHNFAESKLKVLYILMSEAFPETEQFVQQSAKRYSLEIICIPGKIHDALSVLKTDHPEVKAILMGTRYTDPYSGKLEAFSPTDDSWPDYMRVNTVLEWSYYDVWLFLKLFEVPYCQLYDQGYTSLDGKEDTRPNPALLVTSPSIGDSTDKAKGGSKYLPAYMLSDSGLERAGRTDRT